MELDLARISRYHSLHADAATNGSTARISALAHVWTVTTTTVTSGSTVITVITSDFIMVITGITDANEASVATTHAATDSDAFLTATNVTIDAHAANSSASRIHASRTTDTCDHANDASPCQLTDATTLRAH